MENNDYRELTLSAIDILRILRLSGVAPDAPDNEDEERGYTPIALLNAYNRNTLGHGVIIRWRSKP